MDIAQLYEKFMDMDRRIIYLMILIVVAIPLVFPIGLPTKYTPPVTNVWDYLEKMADDYEQGKRENPPVILLNFNYDGSTLPELQPMTRSIIRHCFLRNIRLIGMSWYPAGGTISENLFDEVSIQYDKISGEDYVNFGFKMPILPILMGMATDLHGVLPTDVKGVKVENLPMMDNINSYDDIDLVIDFSGSSSYYTWIVFVRGRFGQELAAGVTGVIAAEAYPLLQTGQLIGLMAGLKAGAEYEQHVEELEKELNFEEKRVVRLEEYLIGQGLTKGTDEFQVEYDDKYKQMESDNKKARTGMDAQAIAHIVIFLFIVLGNAGYFYHRHQQKLKKQQQRR